MVVERRLPKREVSQPQRTEIVFPLPMTVLMKTANVLPVRLWAALTARMGKKSG